MLTALSRPHSWIMERGKKEKGEEGEGRKGRGGRGGEGGERKTPKLKV